MDMEPRVEDLELRYMRLERFTEELSSVVAEQGKAIALLRAQLDAATAKLRDVAERAGGAIPDEPPPHY
jgi:uncharacterized coiled-coil protein SlyX